MKETEQIGSGTRRWNSSRSGRGGYHTGFTVIELMVVLALVGLGGLLLLPALARTQPNTKAILCQNNLRQLMVAWHNWSEDNADLLLTCQDLGAGGSATPPVRLNWVSGMVDFNGGNASNWDPNQDLVKSPLWPYIGQKAALFKCPGDLSSVMVSGGRKPRVRSLSMSQVFTKGEWLDGSGFGASVYWRTYDKLGSIRVPAHTFVFVEEHPDSINDGAFASACTGNQPGDPPNTAKIIDYPAAFHRGGCGFAFADGHAEIHRWQGTKLKVLPTYTGFLALNVQAGDAWPDMQWLGSNTTVRK